MIIIYLLIVILCIYLQITKSHNYIPGKYSVVLGCRERVFSASGVISRSERTESGSSVSASVAALNSLLEGWKTGNVMRSSVEQWQSLESCW